MFLLYLAHQVTKASFQNLISHSLSLTLLWRKMYFQIVFFSLTICLFLSLLNWQSQSSAIDVWNAFIYPCTYSYTSIFVALSAAVPQCKCQYLSENIFRPEQAMVKPNKLMSLQEVFHPAKCQWLQKAQF